MASVIVATSYYGAFFFVSCMCMYMCYALCLVLVAVSPYGIFMYTMHVLQQSLLACSLRYEYSDTTQ